MASGSRTGRAVLILGFLGIIVGVPAAQVAVELRRGERAQFTDLFRREPTEANLRGFETALEGQSWGRHTVRPAMQRLLFAALRDPGAKGILGRDGWIFYRPGVRYLVEPERRDSVVEAIVRFRDQLHERGARLLVVPVPGKASVYPEMLTRRAEGRRQEFRSPTLELLKELDERGVDTVDLFAAFREAPQAAYYLARDTHWTPQGAKLAAETVARKIRQLGWAPEYPRRYRTRCVQVERHGDILAMMDVPGVQGFYRSQVIECEQVLDSIAGLMVPPAGGREGSYLNGHLVDTPLESSVLLLGDSFSRIYQLPEPRSLGVALGQADERDGDGPSMRKRLLPGSAGFPSHLALALEAPVDYIVSDGGAATDVRRKLSTHPAILWNKEIVVWQFAERDIALGKKGWQDAPLPPKLWE